MIDLERIEVLRNLVGRKATSFFEERLELPDGQVGEEIIAVVVKGSRENDWVRVSGNSSGDGFVASYSLPILDDLGEYGKIILLPMRWGDSINLDNVVVREIKDQNFSSGDAILVSLSNDTTWKLSNIGDEIRLMPDQTKE